MPGRMGSGMAMQEQHRGALSAMPDAQPRFRQVDHLQVEVSEHQAQGDPSERQRLLVGSGVQITLSNLRWAFGQDQRALPAVGLRIASRPSMRTCAPSNGVPDGKRAIEAATALAQTWPQSIMRGTRVRPEFGSTPRSCGESSQLVCGRCRGLTTDGAPRGFRQTRFASQPGDSRHQQGQRHSAEERKYEQ